jgi:hypothetical protein
VSDKTSAEIAALLAEPFPPNEIKFRKAVGGRVVPYVTAASVVRRLNNVLGLTGWLDRYRVLPDGAVECCLTLLIGDKWISRRDVGVPSSQEGRKGSYSDALKRAAKKFGVGLDLCFLDKQKPTATPQPEEVKAAKPAKANTFPEDGSELERRLADYDQDLAEQGLFPPGDLLGHVLDVVSKATSKPGGKPYGTDVRTWPAGAIKLAIEESKRFVEQAKSSKVRKDGTLQRLAANEWED